MARRQILIHRAKPKETRVQNGIIWDEKLSAMARFSLIAMLSLPDDWDYSVRGMAVMLKISKDTMSKYMRELEKAGYLKRTQAHSEQGKFASTEYILTDTPGEFGDESGPEPCPKNLDTEAPCPNLSAPVTSAPEKSPQKKRTEQWNGTEEDPPYSPPAGDTSVKGRRRRGSKTAPDWKPERFEGFWQLYPVKKSKQAAIRAWDLLHPDDALLAVMGRALQRQLASQEWQRKLREEGGQGIPYPATWINGRRWEDEDRPARAGPAPPAALPVPSAARRCHTEIIGGEEVLIYDD